jgi:hypothetical protein
MADPTILPGGLPTPRSLPKRRSPLLVVGVVLVVFAFLWLVVAVGGASQGVMDCQEGGGPNGNGTDCGNGAPTPASLDIFGALIGVGLLAVAVSFVKMGGR